MLTNTLNKVILVGKAGSGKDTLREELSQWGYSYGVSLTTRPKRQGEVEGLTYTYVTEEHFRALLAQNAFQEHDRFNGWTYGTLKDAWQRAQVFIRTPAGIRQIPSVERKECLVVYLDGDSAVRRERLALRSDSDSAERRIAADERDFEGFDDFDIHITNAFFSKTQLALLIAQQVPRHE